MIISNRPKTFLVQVLTQNVSWVLFNWVAFVLFDLLDLYIDTEVPRLSTALS